MKSAKHFDPAAQKFCAADSGVRPIGKIHGRFFKMQIFISYASEDHKIAEQIHLALTGAGHDTFFDKDSLPVGQGFHNRIRQAVECSDAFVFLASPYSTTKGSYALTELKYARDMWRHPKGKVIPVRISGVAWGAIPEYLKSVTVLEPEGNIAAEVVLAIADLQQVEQKIRQKPVTNRSWAGFEKIAFLTVLFCVFLMIYSRAPTLIGGFSLLGIEFNINAGHAIVFSIPVIMILLTWLWIVRDKGIQDRRPYSNNKWIIPILIMFPLVASIFLFFQFLTEFSPPGECNNFIVFRYFWDVRLSGIKPELCFNLPETTQVLMPYIYPPFQTWLYIVIMGINVSLSIKLFRFYHP